MHYPPRHWSPARSHARIPHTLALLASVALSACGGGAADTDPTQTETKTKPNITVFSAAPAHVTAGETATLSWTVSEATTLTLEPGVGRVTGTSLAVSPAATTTYSLTATSAQGTTTATTTITVSPVALPSSGKDITAFGFLRSANAISVDAPAHINGTQIQAFLPPGTARTALKPTFVASEKATVTVNGLAQSSGVTSGDFSGPVTYLVTAEDGSTRSWTVTLHTELAAFDDVVTGFMARYEVPAVSIAATYQGRLVYLKAYGHQDVEAAQPATTSSRFRLASLSKPITGVAVMKLVEEGRLSLDDRVFGDGALLGTTYGSPPYAERLKQITVEHLLKHTAGGWPNDDGQDPMVGNIGLTIDELISSTIDARPPTAAPGSAYAYSNFGFAILGRVIERITGEGYEAAVRSLVLEPMGIAHLAIGGNTLADRLPDEVRYYGQSWDPYSLNVARMDAHGGWVGSAHDVARFLVQVDGFPTTPDLLAPETVAAMVQPSAAYPYYACGWAVNAAQNWWHTGSLPGTAAELIRAQNGWNWVVLANGDSSEPGFFADVDAMLWTALPGLPGVPPYDLF